MEAFLLIKGCVNYIRSELPTTADEGEKLLAQHAMAWIRLCVSDRWLERIEDLTSPYEAWKKFKEHYQSRLVANSIDLQQQFFALRQGADQSVDGYMDLIMTKSRELKSLNAELPLRTVIAHVISTLSPAFSQARTSLKIQAPSLGCLDDLRDILLSVEADLKQQETQHRVGAPMAMVARRSDPGGASTDSESEGNPFQDKQCDHCGNMGHIAPFCVIRAQTRCPNQPLTCAEGFPKARPSKSGSRSHPKSVKSPSASLCHTVLSESPPAISSPSVPVHKYEWILDSGASDSLTREKGILHNYVAFKRPQKVVFGNNTSELAHGMGSTYLSTPHGSILLSKVLYVPKLVSNLLSLSTLVTRGYSLRVEAYTPDILILHQDKLVGSAGLQEGVYILHAHREFTAASVQVESTAMKWHRKLGHTNFGTLADMQRKGYLPGCTVLPAEFIETRQDEPCEPCAEGKMHRQRHPAREERAPHINFRVHSDIMGPLRTATATGAKYVLTLMDEASGFSLVRLLARKSDTLTELPVMLKTLATQGGQPIKRLRTDNGGEYMSLSMKEVLDSMGIWHEQSAAHTPEQNGMAERLNRTLMERTRTYLSESGLPPSLWGHALYHANHIRNSVLYAPTGQPPYLYFTGIDSKMDQFHPFGCDVQMHVPDDYRHKLQAKSVKGTHLGIVGQLNSGRYWVLVGKKIWASCDVQFFDDCLRHAQPTPSTTLDTDLSIQSEGDQSSAEQNVTPPPSTPSQPVQSVSLPPDGPSLDQSVSCLSQPISLHPQTTGDSSICAPPANSSAHEFDMEEDEELLQQESQPGEQPDETAYSNPLFQPEEIGEEEPPPTGSLTQLIGLDSAGNVDITKRW